jgi:hypothetical protein
VTARRLLKRAASVAVLRSSLAHFSILLHPNLIAAHLFVPQVTTRLLKQRLIPLANLSNLVPLVSRRPRKPEVAIFLIKPLTQMYLKANLSLVHSLLSFTSTLLNSSPHLQAVVLSHSFQSSILLHSCSVTLHFP